MASGIRSDVFVYDVFFCLDPVSLALGSFPAHSRSWMVSSVGVSHPICVAEEFMLPQYFYSYVIFT